MIKVGVGVDLLRCARMESVLEREGVTHRMFTFHELEYIKTKGGGAVATAAGIFCAKEALGKALGTGLFRAIFQEAEVRHTKLGAPFFAFSGALARRCRGIRVRLSIAHEGEYAIAVAYLFRRGCRG